MPKGTDCKFCCNAFWFESTILHQTLTEASYDASSLFYYSCQKDCNTRICPVWVCKILCMAGFFLIIAGILGAGTTTNPREENKIVRV
jgi:hypothetical protein